MSLFLSIVFHCFTGTDFCSSCHICSVLEAVSESQRRILYALVWPKALWYGMISVNEKEGKKRERANPPLDTLTLTLKFIDSHRILKVEER